MKSKLKSAAQITQLLVKNGDKRKALGCQRFFKTAPIISHYEGLENMLRVTSSLESQCLSCAPC
eukprot:m.84927 g.84927  ORF g.84927 m.84927 type:complete len:64 (-) comp12990_c0_seq1:982-1173(-)